MNKENLLKQLDHILNYLNKNSSIYEIISKITAEDITTKGVSIQDIQKGLKHDNNFHASEGMVIACLDRLIEDLHVKRNGNNYFITWKGKFFLAEIGGYYQKSKKDSISITLQKIQTWSIAGGAAGLLIWEIVKYILEKMPCCACCH
ncbi:MAG: hypothetical protein ACXVPN_09635 [Bacteroidia bacterium]